VLPWCPGKAPTRRNLLVGAASPISFVGRGGPGRGRSTGSTRQPRLSPGPEHRASRTSVTFSQCTPARGGRRPQHRAASDWYRARAGPRARADPATAGDTSNSVPAAANGALIVIQILGIRRGPGH
jgi:hypothetical protein